MTNQIDPSLLPFFDPKGVVLIGASQDPTKLGFGAARNLVQSGYPGNICFVNPKGGTLLGHPVYQAIDQIPDPVDLAVLLVPAPWAPQTLASCGQRGIKAAVVASGGFRETGPEGAVLEAELASVAARFGIRLIGPNCIGLSDTHLPLDTTFLPPPGPNAGDIAFLSHSGAMCAAIIDWSRGEGFGFSRLISLGNQADVTETDLLAPVAEDDHTKVITLYLEGLDKGRRFVEAAGAISRHKPIVALKAGRLAGGQRATASHTGAMAGEESAFDAAFRRAGVLRAESTQEMFDWARALAWCPLPAGPNVAVLTNAGGPGVTAVDALESLGLRLAQLQAETGRQLKEQLPAAASVSNPVDMLASASPADYAACLRCLLADPGVDSVLVLLPPPPMYAAGSAAKALIPVIYEAKKPVLVSVMGHDLIQEALTHFRAAHVAEYRFPEGAASALAALTRYGAIQRRPAMPAVQVADVDSAGVADLLDSFIPALLEPSADQKRDNTRFLPPELVQQTLDAYQIPTPPSAVAATPEEAARAATQIGFPAAVKIVADEISHKSDVGGIRLNLPDQASVISACREMRRSVEAAVPGTTISGFMIQRMIEKGQELIAGMVRDPQFGPLLMVGSGGIEVEGLQDTAFCLAPANREELSNALKSTWAGRKLDGYRNMPAADKKAVLDILARLGQLAQDHPRLREIEINPLLALNGSSGAFAVDVRIGV